MSFNNKIGDYCNYNNSFDTDSNFVKKPEKEPELEPQWTDLSSFLDSDNTFDLFVASLNQDSTPVQNNLPCITSLEAEEYNPATAIFERAINKSPTPEPQLEQVSHTQRKRPSEPPVSVRLTKRSKQHDSRLPLLKERRTQLGINPPELCKRVNRLLKALGSQHILTLPTLKLIEGDNTTIKTINIYYEHINTILDRASDPARAPEALPVEIDPRLRLLENRRTQLGINCTDLCRKVNRRLQALGSELTPLAPSTLKLIEDGNITTKTINTYYDHINTVLDGAPDITSLESEEQNPATVVFEETIHPKSQRHKRPSEPPVSVRLNKGSKQHDPRLPLLKERRIELGIKRVVLWERVNDHLKKLGSKPLALTTLTRIENDTTTKKTIDAYYDVINTVLAEAPEALSRQK
jgi:hypothetical protein